MKGLDDKTFEAEEMGLVSVAALRAVTSPEAQNGNVAHEDRARTQALVAAVQVLNQSGFVGGDREITYSKDSPTSRLVIRVVDKQSGAIVVQWPSEYALQMAQEYQKEHPDK